MRDDWNAPVFFLLNALERYSLILPSAAIEKLSSKLFLLAIIYRQKKKYKKKITLTELFIGEVERGAI